MMKCHHNSLLVKAIVITLLFIISYPSVSEVQKVSLQNQIIEQSILNRYQQILIKSYDYYREKLGFSESAASTKIENFPVLIENNIEYISQHNFHTERFFSRLHAIKNKINNEKQIKPKIITAKTKQKLIRISNIPVNQGYLSSHFGYRKDPIHGLRRFHKGIDIAAKKGSTVNPLGKGKIVYVGYKSGYGNTVEIKHGNTVLTRYAHLKQFLVNVGQHVNIEDKIGLIGNSGRSTGPHLHLEVLFNDIQVDPQIFLANHFDSRENYYQIAQAKPVQNILKKNANKKVAMKVIRKITNNSHNKKYPQVSNVPQIKYQDFVNSVDGLFGFSAPISFAH